MFHFLINENVNSPTISFVSEDPGLQYVSYCMYIQYSRCVFYTVNHKHPFYHYQNFLVVGKCIGQDNYECKAFYAEKVQLYSVVISLSSHSVHSYP